MAMPRKTQYALQGVCRFENFPECLNQETEVFLGRNGGVRWYMSLENVTNDYFCPKMYFKDNVAEIIICFYSHFKVLNTAGIKFASYQKRIATRSFSATPSIKLQTSKVLEDLDDWLTDGGLRVEYGIHVESIRNNRIWAFNFKNKMFDPNSKADMFTLKFDDDIHGDLHCSKQLLSFHSSVLSENVPCHSIFSGKMIVVDSEYNYNHVEKCLQIAHGVRLKLPDSDWGGIIKIAEKLDLQNVTRYCEQQLIEKKIWPYDTYRPSFDRKRYMKHTLKRVQSVEQFKKIYGSWDLGQIPSEAMKMIMDKFMEIEL